MVCNRSAILLVALVVLFVGDAQADANGVPPPPVARRAGPSPPPATSSTGKASCPMVLVPNLVDACRSPPGLAGCAAQCIVQHYRGGHCDVLPNGHIGDCACMNCLGIQA